MSRIGIISVANLSGLLSGAPKFRELVWRREGEERGGGGGENEVRFESERRGEGRKGEKDKGEKSLLSL
jgi:hypothetical protein